MDVRTYLGKENIRVIYVYIKGDIMSRYKESRSTESSLPLGAGEIIHKTEIEDTTTVVGTKIKQIAKHGRILKGNET